MGWEIWLWAGPVPVGHIRDFCRIFDLTPANRKVSSPGEEQPDAPKDLTYVVVHAVDVEPLDCLQDVHQRYTSGSRAQGTPALAGGVGALRTEQYPHVQD